MWEDIIKNTQINNGEIIKELSKMLSKIDSKPQNQYYYDVNKFENEYLSHIFDDTSEKLDKHLGKYIVWDDKETPFHIDWNMNYDVPGMGPVYNNDLARAIIESINSRNDNVMHGKWISGPAYVTGETINFDEKFEVKDGYCIVNARDVFIPQSKEHAKTFIKMSVTFKVYDNNGNKITVPRLYNEQLGNAVTSYIRRHAIYSSE